MNDASLAVLLLAYGISSEKVTLGVRWMLRGSMCELEMSRGFLMDERQRMRLRHVADVRGACAEVGMWFGNVSGVGSGGAGLSFCVRSSAGAEMSRSSQLLMTESRFAWN